MQVIRLVNVKQGSPFEEFRLVKAIAGKNPIVAAGLFAVVCNVHAAMLTDLGFESPQLGNGNFSYDTVAPGWVFSGLSGISANNSGFTFQNPAAPEGMQVAVLQNNGSFSQSFSMGSAESFSITFSAAQRMMSTLNSQNFNVLVDNTVIGNFLPTGSDYQTYSTSTVNLGSGTHTLSFVGLNNSGDNTAFLDNILVSAQILSLNSSPVPEPGSIPLMLGGIGLMGGFLRHSRLRS